MENEAVLLVHNALVVIAVILTSGVIFSWLSKKLNIPDVVFFLLGGVLLGKSGLGLLSVPADSAVNQFILIFAASVILFHGGLSTELNVLKRTWRSLVLLATTGVLVTALVVAVVGSQLFGVPFLTALLMGSVIASTDPAALIPILQKVKVRAKVSQTVVAESAFNDATGSILTTVVLAVIAGGSFSLGAGLTGFVKLAGIGMVIGVIVGVIASFMMSRRSRHALEDFETVTVIAAVLVSYLVSDALGGSGFMAVFTAGLVVGNGSLFGLDYKEVQVERTNNFLELFSMKLRMLIFILLGSQVEFAQIAGFAAIGLVVSFAFIFIARPLCVLTSTLPDRGAKWEPKEILFLMWTRETGVIPAALAGMIVGKGVEGASLISAVTFMAILATLLIQATSTPWLVDRLQIKETANSSQSKSAV